ncbi:hypothetical protein CONLIGDRAFT_710725 [Coniochaeta ligniaria NRRL 30616]|uniref:Actin-like ATPase domain-containing protein n=1 Tax=Coniochaeta ligniaria NRRL 30616 TaxID=1408157 RepID=A0A1J7K5P4_9PEZI|nr:hypothetical protein CONLIGDRAFT_710725 [Coniochaeta ligniaria NRRL 30616]
MRKSLSVIKDGCSQADRWSGPCFFSPNRIGHSTMSFSRASTATLGRGYEDDAPPQGLTAPAPEEVPDELLDDLDINPHARRLIIAVDFGTTYSAVSYTVLEGADPVHYLDLNRIRSIQNFPDAWNWGEDGMKCEVPTEVIYPLDRKFREKENLDDPDEEEGQDTPTTDPNRAAASAQFRDFERLAVFGQIGSFDADQMSIDGTTSFRWGYGAHEAWRFPTTHADPKNKALSRFKLLLDNSPMTDAIRDDLKLTLDELKRLKIIKEPLHVIVDFLTCLLRHTQSELEMAGFDDSYSKEIVLCVPAIWSQKACRDMQTAMARAMGQAKFEGVDVQNNSIENLFIVSEPEAAAAYVLATERGVSPGDTFVLLDAGGGTVDANTYTVSMTTPLRLTREVVPPGGGLHGSSYLNEGFRRLLMDILKDETYLEDGENTIAGCVERIMINDFEYRLKRTFDCYTARGYKVFDVPGLRENPKKDGFMKGGRLRIHVGEIMNIFLTHLEGIGSIMEDQINAALAAGTRVEKVVLIGGFAGSISLKKYLEQRLKTFCEERNCHISLLRQDDTAITAVASGAVLRAVNKEQGPKRHARSSYGILRREPYMEFPEHAVVTNPYYDPHDGLPYVVKTVDWVLKLGEEIEPVWRCPTFESCHTFDCWPVRPLICKEVLYVSDRSTESHYQLRHPKNEGAEKVGEIVVDFTFLRDEGLIQPVDGGVNARGRRVGKRHYRVTFTIRNSQKTLFVNWLPRQSM